MSGLVEAADPIDVKAGGKQLAEAALALILRQGFLFQEVERLLAQRTDKYF